MRDLIVDGVPLRDPLGEWFIDYTRSRMLPEIQREYDSDPAYGVHGSPALPAGSEAYFTTGKESWVLNITGTDAGDFAQNFGGLEGHLSRPELTVLGAPQRSPLVSSTARVSAAFNVSADLVQYARFRKLGSTAVERIGETAARCTYTMENLTPFWMSNPYYTSGSQALASATQTVTLDGTAAGSTALITDGLVRIKGPLTVGGSVTVRDRGDTFRAVRYTATTALGAGEYVVIDMATLRARLHATAIWDLTGGTDVASRVTTSGDGAFYLSGSPGASWPGGNQSYYAVAFGVGHTNGSTAVDFRIRRSYAA
jgi:hypothetical protein